jgi:hypothetical protein
VAASRLSPEIQLEIARLERNSFHKFREQLTRKIDVALTMEQKQRCVGPRFPSSLLIPSIPFLIPITLKACHELLAVFYTGGVHRQSIFIISRSVPNNSTAAVVGLHLFKDQTAFKEL